MLLLSMVNWSPARLLGLCARNLALSPMLRQRWRGRRTGHFELRRLPSLAELEVAAERLGLGETKSSWDNQPPIKSAMPPVAPNAIEAATKPVTIHP